MVGEEEERFVGGSHSNRTCFLVFIDKRKQGFHERWRSAETLLSLIARAVAYRPQSIFSE